MNHISAAFITSAVFSLGLSPNALADDTGLTEEMYAGEHHQAYHEPMHVGNEAKHAKGDQDFARADRNKDGVLSRKEAKKLSHVSKHFDEIDSDKDGSIDRDEIHRFMANKHDK